MRSIQTFSRLGLGLRLRVLKGNQFLGKQLWDKATMNFGMVFVMRSGSKLWGAFRTFKMNLLPRNRESTDNLDDDKGHDWKEDGKYLPDDLTGGKGHPDRRPSCSRSLAIGTRRKFAYASKFSFKMLFISLTPFYF
jgi:hypothetical protein